MYFLSVSRTPLSRSLKITAKKYDDVRRISLTFSNLGILRGICEGMRTKSISWAVGQLNIVTITRRFICEFFCKFFYIIDTCKTPKKEKKKKGKKNDVCP
ncbi:hypothetical protein PUN28_009951 [Cardiocondyla obscurior]|uniref:Uncharacterized protein n=1 Tax=Cardiocondyla obscurior TaxID=286306 RepID=A0AAW2FNM7_9HYME